MRRACIFLSIAALLIAAPPALKQGMDTERLARIPERMKAFAESGTVAGTVTLLQRHGQVILLEASGYQDLEGKKPMRTDSIFQIMSMTKPFVGVGIMMLAEEGKLSIVEPVERYLPEFKGQMLADGKKPVRPITVRDLMVHTSGMPAPTGELKDLYWKLDRTLAEAVPEFAKQPLRFEPGSKWEYSNTGIATLGRIIEVISGQPFEQFMAERIYNPLGMKDTFIFPPAGKTGRIAIVYDTKDGKLTRSGARILGGDPGAFRQGAKYSAPEFSMFSTASDLSHFYQMLLNGGVHNGRRFLSKAAIETMSANHSGTLKAGHLAGAVRGLTFEVIGDVAGTSLLLPVGTYGHGGAFGTHGWVDPKRDMVGVFLVGHNGSAGSLVKHAFMQMAGASVVE
jgi:CubicO group peptidase (beta-lactamase class C family)